MKRKEPDVCCASDVHSSAMKDESSLKTWTCFTKKMLQRKLWPADQLPVLERGLLWWPAPRRGAELPWLSGDYGNDWERSPGSNSTSKLSAAPSDGAAAPRWPTLHLWTTASWPRPLGSPLTCVRMLASPEEHVWMCETKTLLLQRSVDAHTHTTERQLIDLSKHTHTDSHPPHSLNGHVKSLFKMVHVRQHL